MSLSKEIEKLKYDKRLTDWHLSRGKMSKEELQKYLMSLPDSGENVETFRFSEEERNSMNGHGQ
ncbi:MAG: hypothetical protein NDI61_09420 [Bdellovibrionaceae bacterium]|nr:hypothetical protein [Pseudobdellovibrionaceae bacterium]